MFVRNACVGLLSVAVAGCASFRAYELPIVAPSDMAVQAVQKPRVFSRWVVEAKSAVFNEQGRIAAAALQKKYFDDAIARSGCCVLVEGPGEADLVVDGKALNDASMAVMIPAFITGLSLYTIPSWVTAKVHIQVNARKGELARRYELRDSATMVQWLPLVLAMPFRDTPFTMGKAVDENLYNNLIYRMKRDGLLRVDQPALMPAGPARSP